MHARCPEMHPTIKRHRDVSDGTIVAYNDPSTFLAVRAAGPKPHPYRKPHAPDDAPAQSNNDRSDRCPDVGNAGSLRCRFGRRSAVSAECLVLWTIGNTGDCLAGLHRQTAAFAAALESLDFRDGRSVRLSFFLFHGNPQRPASRRQPDQLHVAAFDCAVFGFASRRAASSPSRCGNVAGAFRRGASDHRRSRSVS